MQISTWSGQSAVSGSLGCFVPLKRAWSPEPCRSFALYKHILLAFQCVPSHTNNKDQAPHNLLFSSKHIYFFLRHRGSPPLPFEVNICAPHSTRFATNSYPVLLAWLSFPVLKASKSQLLQSVAMSNQGRAVFPSNHF